MKRLLICLGLFLSTLSAFAQSNVESDTTSCYDIDEVSVVSFYRSGVKVGDVMDRGNLVKFNRGQEPSFILSRRPSVFAYSDTGSEYGYSYFRMRGMDQTRVNMTLDGMPLNEGEDMGVYFSNYPDMLSSMHSANVACGASITGNGVAGYAGSIDFESVDLKRDTLSSAYVGGGSYNTFKSSVEYNSGLRGRWAVHLKATQQQSDGYREHSYNNSQSAFAKVGYFINDNHSVDLLTFVGKSRNGQGWIGSSLEEIAANRRANGCSESEIDNFLQNVNKIQYSGVISNRLSITASLYYNYLKGYYNFDLDNFMTKVVDPSWQSTGEIDYYNLKHHMFGGNVAAKVYLREFIITAGVNASTFNRQHIGTYNLADDELWNNRGFKNDLNVFARGEYNFRGLKVTGNLQYRHADFDYRGDVDFRRVNWDFLNWSGRFSYQFNGVHGIYAMATQTHREPTRSDMFGGEENLTAIITTQAESVIDYELGYNVVCDRLTGNINLYLMNFQNELILNGEMGTNGLPLRESVERSFRTGVELSLVYEPIDNLVLENTTSYSINKIKTREEMLNHTMSPNWLVNQSASYGIKGVEVSAELKYRSKMYFDMSNLYQLDSSLRFAVHVSYTYRAVTVGMHINNIFNEVSFSSGMMGANGPLYFIDAPRTFQIDFRWTF